MNLWVITLGEYYVCAIHFERKNDVTDESSSLKDAMLFASEDALSAQTYYLDMDVFSVRKLTEKEVKWLLQ